MNDTIISVTPDVLNSFHKYGCSNHHECNPNLLAVKHKIGRNEECPCESGKKFKKCCNNINKQEIIVQELNKMEIISDLYTQIDHDMRSKYIKQFGEIKTGNPITITREDNIKRHASIIAFWLKEISIKDYNYKEKNMHKFAMCSTNASNLIERSHRMGFLSAVINELQKIYSGYLYFNKKIIQLLQENDFDIDLNIPSLILE